MEKNNVKLNNSIEKEISKCVSCGICTANCDFLKKYNIDFSEEKVLDDLAYNCFLCNKCTEVCPHDVDGRDIFLQLRRRKVRKSRKVLKAFRFLRWEKSNYIFRNYKHGNTKSVFFPGCNYPSNYPKTTAKLMDILEGNGIGIVFDCCGKPISELGMEKEEEEIISRLNSNFSSRGIEEIVVACPNCYDFLSGKLDVNIVSIYEKLSDLGIGKRIEEDDMKIFLPCPDRKAKKWLDFMSNYLPSKYSFLESVQCCGAGGCASFKERALALDFSKEVEEEAKGRFYVYCGTCGGNFTRKIEGEVLHILNEVLESDEKADVKNSLANRAKTKFI